MRHFLSLFTFLFLLMGYLQAQVQHNCGLESFYKPDVAKIYENYSYNQVQNRSNTDEILSVRTVIHLLYETESEIISNDSILTIVENANKIFCGIVDTAMVEEEHKVLIHDTGIRLCLATEDPMGNPTIGITRTPVDQSFDINDPMEALKSDDLGGKSPWDTTSYLNIWLMPTVASFFTSNYGIPLTGFGPLDPFVEPSSIPGVAVDIGVFTGANLGAASTGEGIFAHECGHSLGLIHTFGVGESGVDICDVDDFVDDTPLCGTTFFCAYGDENTCDDPDDSRVDMVSNTMNVGCMIFFTPQQSEIMRNNLLTTPELLSTDCDETQVSVFNREVSAEEFGIFPNPSTGSFRVDFSGRDVKISKAELYDVSGKKVAFEYAINNNNLEVKITENIPNGLYILSLNDVFYSKVLIQNQP